MLSYVLVMVSSVSAQKITETLVVKDPGDSSYIKGDVAFGKDGSWFVQQKVGENEHWITSSQKLGPYEFIGGIYGSDGEIKTTVLTSETKKGWFYKNGDGTKIYGPVDGELIDYITSDTKNNIAISVKLGSSTHFYVNGKLIASQKSKGIDPESDDWCAFSENGNVIYATNTDGKNRLFVNNVQIDSSGERYTKMAINDNGDYLYAEGRDGKKEVDGYDYMFFIHSKDTVIGPVRTVWESKLNNDGSFYYSGDDDGPSYIAINNFLYKDLKSVNNIKLLNSSNYMFQSKLDNDSLIIVANGKIHYYPTGKLLLPSFNKNGEVSAFTIEDHYLYKIVNGIKDPQALSKYGVRPEPLYISPQGEELVCYITDDSIYLYQNGKQIWATFPNRNNFAAGNQDILPGNAYEDGNSDLIYLAVDSIMFLVYKGGFSKPMIDQQRGTDIGQIVAGELTIDGFYCIQQTSSTGYSINVDNKTYAQLDGVDKIFEDYCYLEKDSLVFYGIKNGAFYQFKLSL